MCEAVGRHCGEGSNSSSHLRRCNRLTWIDGIEVVQECLGLKAQKMRKGLSRLSSADMSMETRDEAELEGDK